jgi:hypothetical protein
MAETIPLMILRASMPMIGIGGFLCSLASDDPLLADVFQMLTEDELLPLLRVLLIVLSFSMTYLLS